MERRNVPGFGVLVPRPPSKPPEPTPPALSHRKLPPIRKCSAYEQKGVYSDVITTFKFQVKSTDASVFHYEAQCTDQNQE